MHILFALVALVSIGAAPVDWTKMVTRMPGGAYVLGNPKAKVRLVEYLSYSCSHCAHFTVESAVPLKTKYVAKGSVAVEVRNAVRDRYDFAAAILARCGGPAAFFANSEALMAAQDDLIAKAQAYENDHPLPNNTPLGEVLTAMAQGSGMTAVMASRGIPAAASNKCLADKALQDTVLGMTKEAWEVRKIKFTPAFFINGSDAGPNSWASLEPKIRAAATAR